MVSGTPSNPPQFKSLQKFVRLVAIALLFLGVSFRFANLDLKVYWHDEVYTSMVITARPGRYLSQALFQNKLVKPDALLAYQGFTLDLSLNDMVIRKGLEDAQHPPFYYVFLRFWAQLWGTSPTVTRSFSSLLSLLLFPSLYWLCLELFNSSLSAWVAIALFAISPFHLVYAQEARQFGLWAALILFSSALLLRAIRSSRWQDWTGYGIVMVISYYTALNTLWISVAHFGYILFLGENGVGKFRSGRSTIFFIVTLIVVALVFIPWLYFLFLSKDTMGATTAWTGVPLPLIITIQSIIFNFSRCFVDFNLDFSNPFAYIFAVPILILQVYAVYVLYETTPRRVWGFVIALGGTSAIVLLLPDLLFGGQRFTVTRYLFPCFIALQLAVVHLLSTYLTAPQKWKSGFAKLVFLILILLGIFSCGVYSLSNTWWNKVLNSNYHQIAGLINRSDRPLVIVDSFAYNPASMISLCYLIKPNIQLLLLPPVGTIFPKIDLPSEVKTIFLFNLPESFRQQFESRFQKGLNLAFKDPWNEVWANIRD